MSIFCHVGCLCVTSTLEKDQNECNVPYIFWKKTNKIMSSSSSILSLSSSSILSLSIHTKRDKNNDLCEPENLIHERVFPDCRNLVERYKSFIGAREWNGEIADKSTTLLFIFFFFYLPEIKIKVEEEDDEVVHQ